MMNLQLPTIFPARRWFAAAALLALVLFSTVAAQAEAQRWLLVFDTSSAMKKRLPAVETEIRTLLTKELTNSLHAGDSIGIWTFNEKLHMGEVPLLTWDPKSGGELATNVVNYIHRQNYSGNTRFAVLQPILGTVIGDSERLTVIIFCDGADQIHGTPYDEGINQTLKQTYDDRKKALQPYVIVLRTQTGKYVRS
ncbi:MAG: hypothetical protein JF609_03660 [Verrucomicrobia bacterium]|nr:hypothetical protein [Verrucomicrobiota bacterium]